MIKQNFRLGLKWFNSELPVTISRHDGLLTLIDFFTYCCINCLHILPTLEQVEKEFSHSIKLIGYHSPKFSNEKVESNVNSAIKRYNIRHPVVCGDGKLWEQLGVFCWPTVIITSPSGQVIFYLVGENVINEWLLLIIQAATKYFQTVDHKCSILSKFPDAQEESSFHHLSFPGKVKVSCNGKLIAISDTGNNRIVITDIQGSVCHIIGGRKKGYIDGTFDSCLFNSPQGVTWSQNGSLYVADTGNDVIRCIDFISNTTESATLQIDMSSPWDLILVDEDKLFVAMAGNHQIWLLALKPLEIGNRKWEKFSFKPFAGNGKEENRNNLYPLKAGFAQPSGLAYSKRNELLFVADSESSSVRSISLSSSSIGAVKNVVGGSIDPTDLFSFGDAVGSAQDVRLQHPMAVAYNESTSSLVVADTYNHKVKLLNPLKRNCDEIKLDSDIKFCEPSGLDFVTQSNCLLVCDTNNHRIIKVNFNDQSASEFEVHGLKSAKINSGNDQKILLGKYEIESGKESLLTFDFHFAKNVSFTKDTIQSIRLILSPIIWSKPEKNEKFIQFSDIQSLKPISLLPNNLNYEGSTKLLIDCTFYLCNGNNGTCFKRNVEFVIPLKITNSLKLWNKNQVIKVTHEIS